jgi:hypothetical protein
VTFSRFFRRDRFPSTAFRLVGRIDGYAPDAGAPLYTVSGYFNRLPGWDSTDALVSENMMSMWVAFAATNSSCIQGIDWPVYTAAEEAYLNIKAAPEVKYRLADAFR